MSKPVWEKQELLSNSTLQFFKENQGSFRSRIFLGNGIMLIFHSVYTLWSLIFGHWFKNNSDKIWFCQNHSSANKTDIQIKKICFLLVCRFYFLNILIFYSVGKLFVILYI